MHITHDMSILDVAQRLRTLMVAEWTTNPDRYHPFLSTTLETEAQLLSPDISWERLAIQCLLH